MGKKHKQAIVDTKKSTLVQKMRPFMLPLLFLLGSAGAYFINTKDLMGKVRDASNISPQSVFFIQVLVYIGIAVFIFLGYKFQSLLDKREIELAKKK